MAFLMVRTARALAEDYRMQARQMQTLIDSYFTILALGLPTGIKIGELPKHLPKLHQELVN